jgi:tRNA 2-thiocytidine biosynthesis protein TtcA
LAPSNYTFKSLNRAVGQALHKYDMIADGDRILVGLSGGSDSLSLMCLLDERRRRIPIDYDLQAVYINPGFDNGFGPALLGFSRSRGWRLRVENTDYGLLAHSEINRENPCFLCSRLRRKRIFEVAREEGCNKVALGHNKDDLVETLFLNICYAGEISTMLPAQSVFGGRFTIIRPLAHADEDHIRRFARDQGFPDFQNPCPTAGVSRRQEIKSLLSRLYRSNRKIKGNIFRAMSHARAEYLLKK